MGGGGGTSNTLPTADLSGKGGILPGYYFTIPAGGRKVSFCPGNSPANERLQAIGAQAVGESQSSANEKPQHFQYPVYANQLSVHNSRAQLTLFLYKGMFFWFVPWTYLWFGLSLLGLRCSSVQFPNKPIFAGKITDDFIFKVNRSSFSVFPGVSCLFFSFTCFSMLLLLLHPKLSVLSVKLLPTLY